MIITKISEKLLKLHNQKCTIKRITNNIDDTSFATDNLIDVIGKISNSVESQLTAIFSVVNNIKNFSQVNEKVNDNTENAQKISKKTIKIAEKGHKATKNSIQAIKAIENSVTQVKNEISSLNKFTNDIQKLLNTIKDIAQQTKILSINAAIEAARAGESGKGFAVVADEVGKLAKNSDMAAEDIENVITTINKSINKTKNAMQQSSKKVDEGIVITEKNTNVFNKIINSVKITSKVINEIKRSLIHQNEKYYEVIESTQLMNLESQKLMSMIEIALIDTENTKSAIKLLEKASKTLTSISNEIYYNEINLSENEITKQMSLTTFCDNELRTLDPAISLEQNTSRILSNLHLGLLKSGISSNILPGIAKSWYIKKDNLTWIFNLRNNARFHNGRIVNAYDIRFTYERLLDPKLKSPAAWLLLPIDGAESYNKNKSKMVSGIKILNKFRIAITLKSPYSGFLLNLAQSNCSILAKEDVKSNIFTGCGCYILSKKFKTYYKLTAFKNYYGGDPYVKNIIVRFKDNEFDKNLIKGIYDFAVVNNFDTIKKIIKNKDSDLRIQTDEIISSNYGCFNMKSNSIFARNKELRKAINYVVNKDKIIREIFNNFPKLSKSIFPPSMINDSTLHGYPCNPQKAKTIIRNTGINLSNYKIRILARENTTGIKTNNEKVIEYIIEDLKKINLKTQIIKVPAKDYYKPESVAKVDMIVIGWVADTGDPDNYLQPIFNPKNYANFGNYDNPKVIELMDKAKEILVPTKRIEFYKKIQRMIIDDIPWLHLYHPKTIYATKKSIENVKYSVTGQVNFDDILISTVN